MRRRRRFTATVAAALLAGGVVVAYAAGAFGSDGRPSTDRQPSVAVLVGPGPVAAALKVNGYGVALRWTPNNAFIAGEISIALTHRDAPVTGAHVRVTFTMLDMKMTGLTGLLPETTPGTYRHFGPILDMPGHWGIRFTITPPRAAPFTADFTDNIRG